MSIFISLNPISIFIGSNWKASIIQKKLNFQIIGGFQWRLTKIDTGFWFCRSKKTWKVYHQCLKFPLSRKFKVDNSECHAITITEERLKTFKMEVFLFFIIQGSVFWRAKSIISKKNSRLTGISNTRQGFLGAGCDVTLSAPSPHHFVPRCMQSVPSRRSMLRFGTEKLINTTLFASGGNDTLKLIGNWTAKVEFLSIWF